MSEVIKKCGMRNNLTDEDIKYIENRVEKIKTTPKSKFNYRCPFCMINFIYFESALDHLYYNICRGRTWY